MIRSALKSRKKQVDKDAFRYRGVDNTRVEALSDGIFAIATALLIISTSIPETYAELVAFLKELVPFAICIGLLTLIWYQHYMFFLRYGFKDAKIIAINTLLLFLILYYIYPLKFLFTLLNDMFTAGIRGDGEKFNYLFTEVIKIEEGPNLMVIYGIGAAAIFLTLAWMYYIAFKRRKSLQLNAIEVFDTKSSMYANLLMGAIPMLSIVIANLPISSALAFTFSGMIYMIYPAVMMPFGNWNRKKRAALLLI